MVTDTSIDSRTARLGVNMVVFEDYSNGAITAGTNKREWIIPFNGHIVDVICDSAGVGGNNSQADIIDVNLNGTTIYTTQGNRPSLPQNNTGLFAEAGEPDITALRVGDTLSYDVDQVDATGSNRFKISIICQTL